MNVIEKPVSINAIKKLNYTGSYCGMRYMLEKKDGRMAAHTYPEPFNYEKTPEEKIVSQGGMSFEEWKTATPSVSSADNLRRFASSESATGGDDAGTSL